MFTHTDDGAVFFTFYLPAQDNGINEVRIKWKSTKKLKLFRKARELKMAGITLSHISKTYRNGFQAVKDFNLEIGDHEFIVFVGPSGCGKSTMLRMIAGLEDISEGELWIGNRLMNSVDPGKRNLAMVFQNYALYPNMTVYQNLAFGLKAHKVEKTEIERRVQKASSMLEIKSLLDRKPAQLSGGQMQRVAIGSAIVRDADAYLFDEPLSNLDAKLRTQMRVDLKKIYDKLGSTVIYVTHDQVEAMTLATRIVVMRDGMVQQVGTPRRIYEKPVNRFVAGFLGLPQMNFLNATVEMEEGRAFLNTGDFRIPLPQRFYRSLTEGMTEGTKVEIGIRPEDLMTEGEPFNAIPFEIEMIENLGSHFYLHGFAGSQSTTVKLESYDPKRRDRQMKLYIDPEKMHLFDKGTGESIEEFLLG